MARFSKDTGRDAGDYRKMCGGPKERGTKEMRMEVYSRQGC